MPPFLWDDDEIRRPRTRGPQDGDLKVRQVGDVWQLCVRAAGVFVLDYFLRAAQRGTSNGVAGLDATGKVPVAQLPATLGAVEFGSIAGTACEGNDGRLSNARTPTAHVHAQTDVTGLVTDLAAKATLAHVHAQADVTALADKQDTAQKNAVLGYAGLDAVGKLAGEQQRYGAVASTACEGNDARLSDARAPTAHAHSITEVTNLQATLDAKQATSEKGVANGYASLGADGKVPAAQLPTSGAAWTSVFKLVDTTRTNTAAVTADPDLQFAVDANAKYAVRGRVAFDTTATADFKWRHAGPATPALVRLARRWVVPGGTALAGVAVDQAFSAADLALTGTGTNGGWIELDGIVVTAVGGTFSFNWAQNTATAGQNTIVRAGSYLEYRKL